jgi:hypothetical protein
MTVSLFTSVGPIVPRIINSDLEGLHVLKIEQGKLGVEVYFHDASELHAFIELLQEFREPLPA